MGAKLPNSVNHGPISGLTRIHQGKVRDTYELRGFPEHQLVVATNRVSIFDFVLSAEVPQKGEVLCAMNHAWRTRVFKDRCENDLVAAGVAIDPYLPDGLRRNPHLHKHASVVRRVEMIPVEAIVRGVLTGSGLQAYRETGVVCGHKLRPGLEDGSLLPEPLFTPTDKAEEGHDEHITEKSVTEKYGPGVKDLALQLYRLAAKEAERKGILIADTKLEFGIHPTTGKLVLADEVFTPDSSRFWSIADWDKARLMNPPTSPSGFDKQFIREWGKQEGIHKANPLNPEDLARVHGLTVPREVIARLTGIYRYLFWWMFRKKLEQYQFDDMGIEASPPVVHVEVLSGSESDVPQMMLGLRALDDAQRRGRIQARRHVISCHRNPEELINYTRGLPNNGAPYVIIAGDGKAAALPGVLKAHLVREGKGAIPVIGVAFAGEGPEDNRAAQLSIECLPNNPVILQGTSTAYFGEQGFLSACLASFQDEFPPQAIPKPKQALLNVPLLPEQASA